MKQVTRTGMSGARLSGQGATRTIALLTGVAMLTTAALHSGSALAQNSFSITNSTVTGLTAGIVEITMDNPDSAVQGYVIAVSYDTSEMSVMDVSIAETIADTTGAELVVPEVFEAQGGFTLGVVLDFNTPFGGQEISPGTDQHIASFVGMADAPNLGPGELVVPLAFTDGAFNSPPLDNIMVINGQSIGAAQGLTLNGGQFVIEPGGLDSLAIESQTAFSLDPPTAVRVLMTNQSGPAQGFVLAIEHDGGVIDLTGLSIANTVTESMGAEFFVPDLNPAGGAGGTLGVVLDFDPPFNGQTIPIGSDQHIATFTYQCVDPVQFFPPDPSPAPLVSELNLVDGVLDSPPLENVIVVAGLSIRPTLNHGTFTCLPTAGVLEDTQFFCGVEDPNGGGISDVEGLIGSTAQLCFFYTEGSDPQPNDGVPQCVGDNIQAFQLALNFDCNLNLLGESFTTEGTILQAVGVEFINVSVDNDPNDGDGCDLTIGILLDALPPFEAQKVPVSCKPLQIGCIDVTIAETAPCGACLPVEFRDGADGGEDVPINNVVVIDNQSIQGFNTFDCNVCVVPEAIFVRGDCNFDEKVDIADAQATLSQQFQGFTVPCLDACDANDDGTINLGDTVFLLNYLFDSGPPPGDPGPDSMTPGADPSDDDLDCAEGGAC